MPRNLGSWISRLILNIGAGSDEDDVQRTRRVILIVIMLVGLAIALSLALLYLFLGEHHIASILSIYSATFVIGLTLFNRHLINYDTLRVSQRILIMLVPFLITVSFGGIFNTSAIIMWALLGPLGTAVFDEPLPVFLRWSAAYLFLLFTAAWLQAYYPLGAQPLPAGIITLFFALNLSGISAMTLWTIYYFANQRLLAFRLLRAEQERSENLLVNILPLEIAAILKREPHTIANQYEAASILFADVVSFTPMSATLSPTELVDLLNEVFLYFDALVDKYGLEKIKTIGDCYMVAAGVPRPRPDHAQVIVQMALEMRDYVTQHEFLGRHLDFRIGVSSGPVVAGVIGRKKFIYDLWGDTVNTASRMESQGVSGAIQITEATFEIVKDSFVCESRGTICVKGKGDMKIWHVLSEKA